jgi:glutamate-1-semialdehyde aminotransferase
MKINKAKIRREAAQKIVERFYSSGAEFTCLASVMSPNRAFANALAKQLLDKGINISKSQYAFSYVSNMADMFLMDAAKIVYAKWAENNK